MRSLSGSGPGKMVKTVVGAAGLKVFVVLAEGMFIPESKKDLHGVAQPKVASE